MTVKATTSFNELVQALQISAQLWERVLHTSGGALNLSKCFWYIQYWQWDVRGRPICSKITDCQPSLTMRKGEDSTAHVIERVENTQSKRTLGVYLAPLPDFVLHTNALKEKTDALAGKLRTSALNKTFAFMLYQGKYVPSVNYSLPVCSMNTAQLQSIQTQFISALLNKLGFNQHYPRAVVYGPHELGGLQLIDVRYEQGVQNTQSLLNYVGTSNPIGDYLMISIRHLQLELGLVSDILLYPPKYTAYTTPCWARHLIDFFHTHTITVATPRSKPPSISRLNDISIMETVVQCSNFTPREITDINLVRIFLQIVTISDISTGDGLSISPDAWNVRKMSDRQSVFPIWPRQPFVSQSQRRLWQTMLCQLFLQSHSQRLRIPLGQWTGHLSNMTWAAHISAYPHRLLLCMSPTRYAVYNIHKQRTFYQSTILPSSFLSSLPSSCTPCTLIGTKAYVTLPINQTCPDPSTPAPTYPQLPPFLQALLPFDFRLLYHSQPLVPHASIHLKRLLQRSIVLHSGSDGGLADYKGTFSWLLLGPQQRPLWKCVGPSDGYWRTQGSN